MFQKQRNIIIERGVRTSGAGGQDGDFVKQATHVLRELNEKRDHEKLELQLLNERFSSYVERVRILEATNRKLLADISELQSKWGLDSGKIKEIKEPEILRFREDIDDITRQKVIAEIKAKRAESDAQNFKYMMDSALDSLNSDKTKIKNLERILDNIKKDTEYFKIQTDDINEQIARYLEDQRQYTDQINQLKDSLDKETLERVTRQTEIQTLGEQISFLKAVHEQEVVELSKIQTMVGFDPTQFYRTELERAVRDIRGDFEQLNRAQKRELEEWYKIKIEEVENDFEKEKEFSRLQIGGISLEETHSLTSFVNESTRECINLQQKNFELNARLRNLEEEYEYAKSQSQIGLSEREREIIILRDTIRDLMQTYEDLLGRKTSLEFEINTYRRLLECEETHVTSATETNLKSSEKKSSIITESPASFQKYSSSAVRTDTNMFTSSVTEPPSFQKSSSSAVRTETNMRTSSVEKTNEVIPKRFQVQRTTKGPVGFKEINGEGKFVILENTGRRGEIDLSHWIIKRKIDNETEIIFKFPSKTTIASGGTMRVWSKGQGKTVSPNEFELDISWKTGDNVITKLISSDGEERASLTQKAS